MADTDALASYSEASYFDASTPEQILFGAGTYHHGVALNADKTGLTDLGTFLGVTNGGGKFSIVPTLVHLDIDNSSVMREGATVKDGEEAYIETSITQITPDVIAKAALADVADKTGVSVITSRERIGTGDYYDNFAYIGKTATGKPVVVVFEKALCTSGLEVESKKGEQSSPTVKFNCVAKADSGKNVLPYIIIWPKASTAVKAAQGVTK